MTENKLQRTATSGPKQIFMEMQWAVASEGEKKSDRGKMEEGE